MKGGKRSNFYARMQKHKIGDLTPFAIAPLDLSDQFLTHAYAISTALQFAEMDAAEANDKGTISNFGNLRSNVKASAHDAIATLIALADFFKNELDEDWRGELGAAADE